MHYNDTWCTSYMAYQQLYNLSVQCMIILEGKRFEQEGKRFKQSRDDEWISARTSCESV